MHTAFAGHFGGTGRTMHVVSVNFSIHIRLLIAIPSGQAIGIGGGSPRKTGVSICGVAPQRSPLLATDHRVSTGSGCDPFGVPNSFHEAPRQILSNCCGGGGFAGGLCV
jgi:hypothetical protein